MSGYEITKTLQRFEFQDINEDAIKLELGESDNPTYKYILAYTDIDGRTSYRRFYRQNKAKAFIMFDKYFKKLLNAIDTREVHE